MNTIFDILLQLPLFQGFAVEDFTRILEKVKLHFAKQKTGETLVQEGTPCDRLIFILNGNIAATTKSVQEHYSLTEYFEAPYLIEPQSLFGLYTTYSARYTATTPINSISINKEAVINDLLKYEIFRLNYLNIVSSQLQLLNKSTWGYTPDNIEARISNFIRTHLKRLQGSKSLKIKMEDLATIVNDTRNGVSKALNNMQDKGLLELHRGEIVIPAAEKLFA
ncbi:Crp/Fnr family transcriptional regulator [uncultured Bacteroides sp.]|uniref:Crp/Fnr family transcriptional regulator n=1 Tax=uncultured Bacteroides sp. TaxID=162156 RepID=UPI00262E2F5B|nr:Crp/Fnr family transcriptional regulator [uncultured Bacteroides sp.]